MTGTVDERLAALPPGPYRVEWPAEQGGLFTVWGRPKEDGGWAIPLVASGVQSVMEWLADHLNRLADSGVVLIEREESLDAAWAEAEAALPDGWWFQLDGHAGGPFRGQAGEPKWSRDYRKVETHGHSTPPAALRSLAAALRESR